MGKKILPQFSYTVFSSAITEKGWDWELEILRFEYYELSSWGARAQLNQQAFGHKWNEMMPYLKNE